MAHPTQLKGLDLIDCARANAKQGKAIACEQCGYGGNYPIFEVELKKACQEIGVKFDDLDDWVEEYRQESLGVEFSPDSSTQL